MNAVDWIILSDILNEDYEYDDEFEGKENEENMKFLPIITQDGKQTINSRFVSKFTIKKVDNKYKIFASILDGDENIVLGTYNEEIDATYALCVIEDKMQGQYVDQSGRSSISVLSSQEASDTMKKFISGNCSGTIFDNVKQRLHNSE